MIIDYLIVIFRNGSNTDEIMWQNPDVTVIGTIVFDIFIPSIEKFPENGQAVEVNSFPIFTGGCGANTSIVLLKLGVKVALIGSVGKDLFGEYILNYLKEMKVDTSLIKISNNEPTSTSILLINKKKERSYFHSVGSNKEIEIGKKELDVILNSKIFHIGGVNLLPSLDGKPIAEILRKAKSKNVITSIDLAWDTKGRWMKNLKYSIPYIDILMCNKDELSELTNENKIEKAIEQLHNFGIKILVIKLGEKGSLVSKNFYSEFVPSFKVKSKDTTGAGDAFAGGFLYGILQGKNLYEAARIGNYFGAIATTEFGSTAAIQKLNQINFEKIVL
ncbi:MAG: carbohydrate kinase family protein [Ignavibacteria bacterium]|nr:carbohydrate kinase family protein [Ignavibacteria bacterium]